LSLRAALLARATSFELRTAGFLRAAALAPVFVFLALLAAALSAFALTTALLWVLLLLLAATLVPILAFLGLLLAAAAFAFALATALLGIVLLLLATADVLILRIVHEILPIELPLASGTPPGSLLRRIRRTILGQKLPLSARRLLSSWRI
jgi:hypothetical protein